MKHPETIQNSKSDDLDNSNKSDILDNSVPKQENSNKDLHIAERVATIKHVLKIDAMIFVGIVFLALLGVGITDYKGENAHGYWRYMLILMALTTTLWGVWRSRRLGLAESSKILYQQIILWGAALSTMAVIYLLLGTGRLNYETTGLLVLLTLAFTTFVDGMLVSWKLYVVGVLLLLTLLLATYVESFLWMIVLASVVLVVIVLAFVVWKMRSYSVD